MRMIKPGFEIYDIPDATDHDAVLMHLEKIGRTCYKSEDMITTDSASKFLQNIRNRKHWAMLEHYIFVVSIPEWMYDNIKHLIVEACYNEDSEFILKSSFLHITEWNDCNNQKYNYLASFSATTLNYLIACDLVNDGLGNPIAQLFQFMKNRYPELMMDPNGIIRECDSSIEFLSRDEIKSLPNWLREIHDFMSVKFTVDRGVTHEIVRHRPASYAQESTRYCNYSKGKFGNEITVITPSFFAKEDNDAVDNLMFDMWKHSCEVAEREYFDLLQFGATPQQARSVLPNSLKADIVMTATLHEYRHFFDMRCDPPAHPQMKEVTCPFLREANSNTYYEHMFDDKMYMANNDKEVK